MDYSDLVDTASELIAEYGQPATVRHVVNIATDSGLTITVDATGKTYTRSSGSWVDDGFVSGDSVVFAGLSSAGNNGAKVASTVAALVLTCSTAAGLVDEADVYDVTATANQDDACNVCEQDVNSVSLFASSLVAGSSVSEVARFFMLSGATPQVNDKLVIGSTVYAIEAARPLSPGATVIYWTVRVKA
jgi:hypothetical protein